MAQPERPSQIRPDHTPPPTNLPQLPVADRVAGARVEVTISTDGRSLTPTPPTEIALPQAAISSPIGEPPTDGTPSMRRSVPASSEPPRRDVTDRINDGPPPPPTPPQDPIPGQDGPDEFRRVAAQGHIIPEIGEIPSFQAVAEKIGTDPMDIAVSDPYEIFGDLQSQPPDMQPTREEYIGVALEVLRSSEYPQDALDYAERVGLPSLVALHDDHATAQAEGVMGKFLERMTDPDIEHTRRTLQDEIHTAIDFVERRTDISAQINRVIDEWMQSIPETSHLVGIMQFGSSVRGDMTYVSDVNVALISNGTLSMEDRTSDFFINDRIKEIAPSLHGVSIWRNEESTDGTFPLNVLTAALENQEIELDDPAFRSRIVAKDDATRRRIESAINPH